MGYVLSTLVCISAYFFYFDYKYKEHSYMKLDSSFYVTAISIVLICFLTGLLFSFLKEKKIESEFINKGEVWND